MVVVSVLVVTVVVVEHTPHMNGQVRCTRSPWYWKAKQSERWNVNRPHTSLSFTPKHSCGAYELVDEVDDVDVVLVEDDVVVAEELVVRVVVVAVRVVVLDDVVVVQTSHMAGQVLRVNVWRSASPLKHVSLRRNLPHDSCSLMVPQYLHATQTPQRSQND